MTKSILLLATVAALLLCFPILSHAATQVYDLNADWSDTQNPNGAWSYRQGDGLLISDPCSWVAADYGSRCTIATCDLFGMTALEKVEGGVCAYGPWMYGYIGGQNLQDGDVCFVPAVAGNILWTAPADGTINIVGII